MKMAESGLQKILSINAVKQLEKFNRINFFRTLEIYKMLVAIQGVIIKEKQLNLSKNNELCAVLTCPIPVYPLPHPRSMIALKTSSS